MSPGQHAAQDDGELPSFTGDVPEDLTLAGRVVRRRFYWIFARGATGFGVACLLVLTFTSGLGGLATLVVPGGVEDRPVPVVITLCALAAGCGAASLIHPIPGQVRFVLGAVPAAGLLLGASVVSTSYDPALDHVPGLLGLATLVTGATYVIIAGLRFWSYFKRRLAHLDAARPPIAPPTQ